MLKSRQALRNTLNTRVTVILIENMRCCNGPKSVEKRSKLLESSGFIMNIQTTSARILRSVLDTWWYSLSLKFKWKTLSQPWYEKLAKSEIRFSECSSWHKRRGYQRTQVFHRTNVLCCKERSPQKKKYSNSKVRQENIAVVYYSAMIAATRKVHFSCVLLLPSSRWWRGVRENWLFDTRLTDRS